MARYDPTGYSADDVDDAAPATPFPDPFGPYPDRPYPGAEHPDMESDPPTDPGFAPVFDPFAPEAFWFPERAWYRRKPATAALGAIAVAVLAIVIAVVLLVALDSNGPGRSPVDPSSTTTTAPTTTGLTSSNPPEPPPPPPPPPPSPEPSADTGATWAPQYPRQTQNDRPNVTTPQTRGPDISVRPTHRPAFPNQPGGG